MLAISEMTCPCCNKPFCPITNPIVLLGICDHVICEDCRSKQSNNIKNNIQTIKCHTCGEIDELNIKYTKKIHEI